MICGKVEKVVLRSVLNLAEREVKCEIKEVSRAMFMDKG